MMDSGFQTFQRDFAAHLRSPHRSSRPSGVPAGRAAIYRELVFANLCGFVDRCFPVCRETLGETRWRRLCRRFLADWPLHTPWFREIPQEFVRFLEQDRSTPANPAWLAALAHYEWAELAADIADVAAPPHDPDGDLMRCPVVLNPTLMNLAYDWPVHRIGPNYRPRRPCPAHLLVFRAADDTVRFSEINPATARLIDCLAAAPHTGESALAQVAAALGLPDAGALRHFAQTLLADLRTQGAILGSHP